MARCCISRFEKAEYSMSVGVTITTIRFFVEQPACAALEAPGRKGRHSRGMRVVLAEGAAHVGSAR